MKRLLLVACILSMPVFAGKPVQPEVGAKVTFKVPMNVFEDSIQKALRVFDTPTQDSPVRYWALITKTDGKLEVGGDTDWQSAGFPSMLELEIQKVKKVKRKKKIKVELANQEQEFVLEFAGVSDSEIADWLGEVVCSGTSDQIASRQYLKEAYTILAGDMLTGDLAALSASEKLLLVQFAHEIGSMSTNTEQFDESSYFVVHLGFDANIFNSLKLGPEQRVARIVNNSLLLVLKAFALAIEDSSAVDGLKIERMVLHRPFTSEYPESMFDMDKLELYVPSNLIKAFSELEIDSQQMLDQSVVILNSNRIRVPLAR